MTPGAPAAYRIRVDGHLDDHWAGWLGGLAITRHEDGTSSLTGPVPDQAQLHGTLDRLRDIGATLLSLEALELDEPERPGAQDRSTPTDPR